MQTEALNYYYYFGWNDWHRKAFGIETTTTK